MIELQYFLDPTSGNIYEMSAGAGIEGVELIEIPFDEYNQRLAERQKNATNQQRKEAEATIALAKEAATVIDIARVELARLGLSPTTVDLILPIADIKQSDTPKPTPKPKRRRA